jgi:hypothetical protein
VGDRRELGELRDLLLSPGGRVDALVVEQDGDLRELGPTGISVEAESVSTA